MGGKFPSTLILNDRTDPLTFLLQTQSRSYLIGQKCLVFKDYTLHTNLRCESFSSLLKDCLDIVELERPGLTLIFS